MEPIEVLERWTEFGYPHRLVVLNDEEGSLRNQYFVPEAGWSDCTFFTFGCAPPKGELISEPCDV